MLALILACSLVNAHPVTGGSDETIEWSMLPVLLQNSPLHACDGCTVVCVVRGAGCRYVPLEWKMMFDLERESILHFDMASQRGFPGGGTGNWEGPSAGYCLSRDPMEQMRHDYRQWLGDVEHLTCVPCRAASSLLCGASYERCVPCAACCALCGVVLVGFVPPPARPAKTHCARSTSSRRAQLGDLPLFSTSRCWLILSLLLHFKLAGTPK